MIWLVEKVDVLGWTTSICKRLGLVFEMGMVLKVVANFTLLYFSSWVVANVTDNLFDVLSTTNWIFVMYEEELHKLASLAIYITEVSLKVFTLEWL